MAILSSAAKSVWGKSRDSDNAMLPLYVHMADSAAMASLLWERWLPASVTRTIAHAFGDDPDQARVFVTWMAGVHDLGKASPEFAIQMQTLAQRMEHEGLPFPRFANERKYAHSVASHILLARWLEGCGWPPAIARTFAVVPGGHHGVPPSESDIAEAGRRPEWLGDGDLWTQVHEELAEYAASISGAMVWLPRWGADALPMPVQVLTTATVIVADWLASDDDLFPYVDDRPSDVRAEDAWVRLRLPSAWQAGTPPDSVVDLFRDRFTLPAGSQPRPVQRVAVAAASEMATPGLLIIEAAMGEGKTEAALAAAEVFASRSGAGGCIVALPTMATSDAMFSRVQAWLERVPDARGADTRQTTFLAHGKARLNEDFRGLARLKKLSAIGDDYSSGRGLTDEVVVAHEWLSGRKKGVLANFVVGTIDQLLFGALKSKHLVLRHLALVNKIVIIDEVHAADAYMSVYLRRILSWLGAYRVPVILLSATLPPDARRALAEAYAEGAPRLMARPRSGSLMERPGRGSTPAPIADTRFDALLQEEGYPVVSTVGPDGDVTVQALEALSRSSTVSLETIPDDGAALSEYLTANLADGGCVGIIRNTVKRAQATAYALTQQFPDVTVLLAHSRFIAAHRMRNETRLRELLGAPGSAGVTRPKKLIVVGTQVLEQSLDIDFDLMVSDLAPMDLLLQRMGRLHRHEREGRPSWLATPRFLIAGVEDWESVPPRPVDGSIHVYRLFPLLRALAVLDDRRGTGAMISTPAEIAPLVRAAYRREYAVPDGWESALAEAETDWNAEQADKERRADTFLLGEVGHPGASLVDWVRAGAGDADEDSPNGQAQVRDTEDSVEVLVVQRVGNEIRVMPGVEPHSGDIAETEREPSEGVALAVASSSIRLPSQLCRTWRVNRIIGALERNAFTGWQLSALLKGQLVLVLDENLEATVDGSALRYSLERGLEIDESWRGSGR